MSEIARVEMLVAVERLPGSKYRCLCDCGRERIVRIGHFNAGNVKSCGCTHFRKDIGAKGPCVIEGCDNPRCNSHGWCWQHYTRWRRHGDPMHTEIGKPEAWLRLHVRHEGDECLIWPFGGRNNGYGTLVYEGEHVSAHRKMCELTHGAPPSPDHEAAHSCGNGHLGCVNPRHLRWATPAENQADKLVHGTHNRGERCGTAKLTQGAVRDIRRRYQLGNITHTELAREHGVSRRTISGIVRKETWAWLQ